MAFCIKCGSSVPDGAKFCANCGASVEKSETIKQEERKKVFDGEIHKCPNCGQELKAFEAVCPSCKHELRGIKGSQLIKELNEKLEKAKTEKEKTDIIKNFTVPNTKEDILEFMILASSNFDAEAHYRNEYIEDVSDGWLVKMEQCVLKAEKLGDSDFAAQIKKMKEVSIGKYDRIKKKESKKKKRPIIIALCCIFVPIIIICFIWFALGGLNTNSDAIKIGISHKEIEGQYYEDIIELLEDKGFTNIDAREDNWSLIHKSGAVKSITIDGKDEFYSFSKFSEDANIIILYYK